MKVKVIDPENGVFVELPEELLSRRGWAVGDELRAVELADGIKLVRDDKEGAGETE